MLKSLHDLLKLDQLTEIVDVGANPIDGDPPYKALLGAGLCRVTGFEPQQDALAKLNQSKSALENYLPYAVGDGTTKTLNICRYSGWTSTLKPSAASLNVFPIFEQNAQIIRQVPLETKRLDNIAEIERIDFLKIDIQGGELVALQNARRLLATASVIQIEVSFVTLYDDQPGLGEIDVELRRQGFMPHCFAAVKKGLIAPLVINNNPWQPINQLLEADMVYVKDFRDAGPLSDEQLKNICLIAHACYGSFDLAFRCLLVLEGRKAVEAKAGEKYLALMAAPAARA